jgi:hypothetical protein
VCSLSSNIEKTLSIPGASLNARYQSDLTYNDLAALMRRKSSTLVVINMFGPILTSDPVELSLNFGSKKPQDG